MLGGGGNPPLSSNALLGGLGGVGLGLGMRHGVGAWGLRGLCVGLGCGLCGEAWVWGVAGT